MALRSDGTVWAWGSNTQGQIGGGTGTTILTPVQVVGLNGVTAISAGDLHSAALRSDGTVWSWGAGGMLGDGTIAQRRTPVRVVGLSNVVSISAGTHYSMALREDGIAWAWGSNGSGQLGNGRTAVRSETPVQVVELSDVVSISAGGHHSTALRYDGTAWSWGGNGSGQLGVSDLDAPHSPIPVQSYTGT